MMVTILLNLKIGEETWLDNPHEPGSATALDQQK
jgi:hypothetical protein